MTWVIVDGHGRAASRGTGAARALPLVRQAELVVPAERSSVTESVLPRLTGARLVQALPFLVEDLVADDPSRLHVVPARWTPGERVVFHVVERAWLGDWCRLLEAAGIRVSRAVPETLALPWEPGTWSLLRGPGRMALRTDADRGMGIDCAPGEAVPVGLRLALDSRRAGGAEAALRVVQYCPPEFTEDAPSLETAFDGVDWLPPAPWDGSGPLPASVPNLLWGLDRDRAGLGLVRRLWPGLVAVAATFALQTVAGGMDWALKVRERDELQTALREEYLAVFPEARNVADANLQMRRNLEQMRRSAGAFEAADMLVLLGEFARARHELPAGAIQAFGFEGGRLEVRMEGTARLSAGLIARRLQSTGKVRADIRSGDDGHVVIVMTVRT
ncbi:MAG: type II secretion system protein GspL [Betaproteobacteria bacterium]